MKTFFKKIGSRIMQAGKVLFGLADVASEIAVIVKPGAETVGIKKGIDYIQGLRNPSFKANTTVAAPIQEEK